MPKATLTEQDFIDAAAALACEIAAVKAVSEVESRQHGFNDLDEPTILFERHIFSKRTGRIYDELYPGISNKKPGGYGKSADQHNRLQQAVALDRKAALMSASWGKFQIMGFNYVHAGFNDLQKFINAMYRSERDQLDAFVHYLQDVQLDEVLREKNWTEFARRYNGPDYKKNEYDVKLEKAYAKFSA